MDEELMETFLEQGEVSAGELRGAFQAAASGGAHHSRLLLPPQLPVPVSVCCSTCSHGSCRAPPTGIRCRSSAPTALRQRSDPDPAGRRAGACLPGNHRPPSSAGSRPSAFTSGTVTRDTQLHVADGRKPFKVGHLFRLQGKEHVEIDEGGAGRHLRRREGGRDRVRSDAAQRRPGVTEPRPAPVGLPEAMFGLAVQAKTRGGRAEALRYPLEARGGRPELSGRAQHGPPGRP